VTAPQPDTRTPGEVAARASRDWDGLYRRPDGTTRGDYIAAAVLADADARRAAAGLVVVARTDVAEAAYLANDEGYIALRNRLRAALAAPTPKETDR
jgi:hypothetical protein